MQGSSRVGRRRGRAILNFLDAGMLRSHTWLEVGSSSMRATKLYLSTFVLILTTGVFAQSPGKNPPQQVPANAETCTVQGAVLAGGTDEPLKWAWVTLDVGKQSFRQSTDAAGHFIFAGLPAGTYQLRAGKTGYVPASYRLEDVPTSKTPEAQRCQKLDKVEFRLKGAGVITGRVTDEAGEPLVGVEMDALLPGGLKRDVNQFATAGKFAVTDDLGEFRIYGLAPGHYYLAAIVCDRPEYINSTLTWALQSYQPALYYPGVGTFTEARKIRVEPGKEVHIDFALRAQKLLTLSGRVVDSRGEPVAGAEIRLRTQGFSGGFMYGYRNGSTDQQGNFVIGKLGSGSYVVAARLMQLGDEDYWGEQRVEIAGENVSGLQVQVKQRLRIPGKVTVAKGRKLNFTDLGIYLRGEHNEQDWGDSDFPLRVRENGEFEMVWVKPTRNHLRMSGLPDGYYVRSAFFGGQNVLKDGLDLSGEVDAEELLKITLGPGAGRIEGIVLRGDDPVQGALVKIVPDPPNPYQQEISDCQTREDGYFIIRNVPPGGYRLRAYASAADLDDDDNDSASDGADVIKIVLAEKQTQTVQLRLK